VNESNPVRAVDVFVDALELRELGFDGVTPDVLRYFAISCWIKADLRPKTVQTFAGHSNLQVTMDRYGHLFKSDDHKKAMDAIAADMFGY
jgi:integrase